MSYQIPTEFSNALCKASSRVEPKQPAHMIG